MYISKKTVQDRLIFNEGFKLEVYLCPSGKKTIGVGRCLETNPITDEEAKVIGTKKLTKITREQAYYLLRNDIDKVVKQIENAFPWWSNLLPDRQYVLIDMVFQMGLEKVKQFKKTLLYLSTGFYKQAGIELLDSNYARQTPSRAKRNAYALTVGVYNHDVK